MRMRKKILLGTVVSATLALAYGFVVHQPPAQADGPKNLQVLPGSTSEDEVRQLMQEMSRALGEACDFCHDDDNMAKDTPKKEEARDMMRMTRAINNRHLSDSNSEVTCMTCHRGETTPTQ